MRWGAIGAIMALIACWFLMFAVKSAQTHLTRPLDLFAGWIDSHLDIKLIPHEDIGAACLWLSIYFLILGFVPASVAGMFVRRHRL